MSQALSTTKQEDTLSKWLARPDSRQTITGALAGYLDTDKFLSQLLIHIQTTPATRFGPALATCTLPSQYKAITVCATLGLLPNYQQVALIPRKNSEGQWELTVMPQWQGYKALFERVPDVLEARVAAVHVKDHFVTGGDGLDMQVLEHTYDPMDPARQIAKLEDIRGTYCRFTFRDGRPDRYHFAPAHYISKCKACAGTDVIWNKWFEQMALKTAFRSAYTRRIVNVDPVVQGRVEAFLKHEDALLGNDPRIVDAPRVERISAPNRTAMIAQQINQRAAQTTTFENAPAIQQASTLPVEEVATTEPEPTTEEAPEQEQEQQGNQEPNDAVLDFVEMWGQVTVQNELALKKLLNHFTTTIDPPLSDEDRLRVQQKHDAILATLNKAPKRGQQQKPLVD